MRYVPSREVKKTLGLHENTLRKMEKDGIIQTIKLPSGHRLYNVEKFLQDNLPSVPIQPQKRVCIAYCRVSSRGQKNDLERQIDYIKQYCPTHTIIKDIGSGINFKRKGLHTILDLAYKGTLQEVVVAYKDRLCRFGFELIEYILKTQSCAKIVVLNNSSCSPEEEVTKDLLQILTVFSARVNGLRKYRKEIKNDQALSNT